MSESHLSAVVTSPFRQDLGQPSGLPGGLSSTVPLTKLHLALGLPLLSTKLL